MNKKLIGVLLLAPFLFLFNTASHAVDSEQKTIEDVLNSAYDKFGFVSYITGSEEDPFISIGLDDTRSEEKLREYLDQNLTAEIKEKYKIEIIKRNVEELKKEVLEDLKQES
ncbi:hypothetical protein [Bacillus paralicheniformis]|uniref:hypothetical protein n=1 Tax=Bacillus paralicheniformis TaxID=1648923 RepID=UPI00102D879E|nr:hypothetical protein [Bacillus paralicheniformis]MBC8621177.1 hypothetical protein [Robertmurraya crescens]MCJ8221352.1 hypothetical protein [Bacillus paralicheniformis]MCW4365855.1 hypothetical protein [Bacillus paralicheniformis]MEC2211784.1 hypothetical protein [Bacillus paralicheniformis]MED1177228.1 hypothetical protein [Bacillus paralicheniformis]